MSKNSSQELSKIENQPLWKEANSLVEYMYGKLNDFPQEEEFYTRAKLRGASVDFIFWLSLALGNSSPTGRDFDWSYARKYATALKTIYRLAGRQKFIDLEPEIMVRLDKILYEIDQNILASQKESEAYRQAETKRDLKPWQEKYRIWQQLNEGKKS